MVGVGRENLLTEEDDVPEHVLFIGLVVDGLDDGFDEFVVAGLRADKLL